MGEKEWKSGSLVAPQGVPTISHAGAVLDRLHPSRLDIVLHPNPKLAVTTIDVAIDQMWGEEVILHDVPVKDE